MTSKLPTYAYERVHEAIKAFHAEHGRCPRQFELATIMKVSRTNAAQMYHTMIKLGYVTGDAGGRTYKLNSDAAPPDFWAQLRADLHAHSGGTANLSMLASMCIDLKEFCAMDANPNNWDDHPDWHGTPESMDEIAKAVLATKRPYLLFHVQKYVLLLTSWAEARLGIPDSTPIPKARQTKMEDGMFAAYNAR